MDEKLWQALPTVPLLQWLTRGSLKQNLLQGIRLWVWLHLLYGEAGQSLELPNPFTYAEWRDCFFSATHPVDEKKPNHSDLACPCHKSAVAWLFAPNLSFTSADWRLYCHDNSAQIQTQIEAFTQALKVHDQCPDNLDTLLEAPLFSMTRRTLYGDLRILTSISWLSQTGQRFCRVRDWPEVPIPDAPQACSSTNAISVLTQPDLAAIGENLSREIGGNQRFFVHVDYVIPQQKLDRVDDWQALLADLWQRSPIPPVSLRYLGAAYADPVDVMVFPVCIYYFRRGPYLCAFGQVPHAQSTHLDWRNYRLDRILQIEPRSWPDPTVPGELRQHYNDKSLPHPDEIAIRMEEAWGFDYYQPARLLLLRFDQEWNDRYIRDTIRHTTFQRVSLSQAKTLIRRHLQDRAQTLLSVLAERSPDDAYYTAMYRENDPNVHQRLRAWRPRVEILLPETLRQRFVDEIKQEAAIYVARSTAGWGE